MFLQNLKQILTKPIFKFKINYKLLNPARWGWQKLKEFLKIFLLTASVVLVFLLSYDIFINDLVPADDQLATDISDQIISYLDYNNIGEDQSENVKCNVKNIQLYGDLFTYIPPTSLNDDGNIVEDQSSSEDIIYHIEKAEKNDSIKAIILEIDSYGGSPVAGEEISIALKNAKKPTVALIRTGGVSSAYFAATGANKIFASKNSDVGSIGVTMSYLDSVGQNKKDGLTCVPLSSGKFKDTGNPNKILSPEEKDLLMRDVNIIYNNFIKTVAENRNLDIEKVKKMADGSTMLGEMALQNGLIDQIGGLPEVKKYLKEKIGQDVEVCW